MIDYHTRYIEVAKFSKTTSSSVIVHLKSIFTRHGVTQILVSDNGPQYSASSFATFAEEYGYSHVTSSPKFPQANGAAERAVETVKSLLTKNEDPYIALTLYRSTPLENRYSPAELLMSRRIRTIIPIAPAQLNPSVPDSFQVKRKEQLIKERQRENFNHHRGKDFVPLKQGQTVWIPDTSSEGQVTNPRSYEIQTSNGTYRRNRSHVLPLPTTVCNEIPPQPSVENESPQLDVENELPRLSPDIRT